MRGSVLLILAMTGVATLAQITSPEASLSAPDTDSDKVLPESLVFIKELRNTEDIFHNWKYYSNEKAVGLCLPILAN